MHTAESDRWVTLSGVSWFTPLLIASPLILFLLLSNGVRLAAIFLHGVPHPWSIVLLVVIGALIACLIVAIVRLIYPPVQLNAGRGLIRAGQRTAAYSEVSTAQLLVTATSARRGLTLLLRTRTGVRAIILIRDGKQRTLAPKAADLVRDLIERSGIELPVSPDDPKGKFARYNFPDHVTRADALALVEHPPALDEPLPIPPRL
ncbi:hypothetical protein C5B96_06755 [Subtercola sp. Z020]|uniref:hypothetical protein n=1 Tax=Subtercola sp. Z020 TaxID=2080582 RepID=UPI000CE909AE|nr:hypothetical protein [Subtercola sp. Z020]PPF85136.1 hypothetical protein C5B96_06755 [Subtercola sp. Z020]